MSNGANMMARAWTDPTYREHMLADGCLRCIGSRSKSAPSHRARSHHQCGRSAWLSSDSRAPPWLRILERPTVVEISGDTGGTKRVIAHMHDQPGRRGASLHHAPGIDAVHLTIR